MLKGRLKININVMYVIPAALIILFVMIYPLIYTFVLSFYKNDLFGSSMEFIKFEQYKKLFSDPVFILSIKNTFLWTIGCVSFQFLLGFLAAGVLNQEFIKYKMLIRILIMLPWVLPSVIGVNIWKWSYHSDFGIINGFLKFTGIVNDDIQWLTSGSTAMTAAIIVNVWKMFPFVMLMMEAALQSVPRNLKDAAKVDGCNDVSAFFKVTVPYISATSLTVLLLLTIWTFNAFTFIYVLTEGGPVHRTEILPMFIYKSSFRNYDFGKASAAGVVLFSITTIFSIFYFKFFFKEEKV